MILVLAELSSYSYTAYSTLPLPFCQRSHPIVDVIIRQSLGLLQVTFIDSEKGSCKDRHSVTDNSCLPGILLSFSKLDFFPVLYAVILNFSIQDILMGYGMAVVSAISDTSARGLKILNRSRLPESKTPHFKS